MTNKQGKAGKGGDLCSHGSYSIGLRAVSFSLEGTLPCPCNLILELCAKSFLSRLGGPGLPRKGVIFEGGVWQSRLVAGDKSKTALEFRETEIAFDSPEVKLYFGPRLEREAGMRDGTGLPIHHARTPGAKPIERCFFEWQSRMSVIRDGYKGFDERRESSQAMKDFARRVEAGIEHPGNEWLSLSEYAKNYRVKLEEFPPRAAERTLGRAISPRAVGRSDPETSIARTAGQPRVRAFDGQKTDPPCEREGHRDQTLAFRKRGLLEQGLAAFIGKPALAFWNLDFPEFLTVTDPARRNFIAVERKVLPAMSATPEQLAKLSAERRRFNAAAVKGVFGGLSHPLRNTIYRDGEHREADKPLGDFIEAEKVARKAKAAQRSRSVARIRNEAAARGDNPNAVRNPDRYAEALELERLAKEQLANEL
jgi:hypothetical protein